MKSISLVIPVYNEVNITEQSINRCISALSKDFEDFELIIIDDGSTDGTSILLDKLATKEPRLKVLHNIVNLNVGVSVQRGMLYASKELVVHNGIDLPLAPEEIMSVINMIPYFQLLVIQRKTHTGYSYWRKATSFLNYTLLRLLFPSLSKGLYDLNFTQVYSKEIISYIIPLAKSPAFTTPEMIFRAKLKKYDISSITIDYQARSTGKGAFGKPHDILWSLYDMIRFRLKKRL